MTTTTHPLLLGLSPEQLEQRPVYDDAPRPLTPREAVSIAAEEYGYRYSSTSGQWMCLYRGSDGGMHYDGPAYSEGAARGWCQEKGRALVRRLLAGECQHTVMFDRGRDRFYLA